MPFNCSIRGISRLSELRRRPDSAGWLETADGAPERGMYGRHIKRSEHEHSPMRSVFTDEIGHNEKQVGYIDHEGVVGRCQPEMKRVRAGAKGSEHHPVPIGHNGRL